jgi:hypothetical protein
MKERVLFAVIAGLGLVSASPPSANAGAQADPAAYPPCSRTVTDHCIQLYERGVRAPRARARSAGRSDDELTSIMAADDQPRIEMASAGSVPAATPGTRQRRAVSQRVRRAGERG